MTIAAINAAALKTFIARIERLEAEKAALSEDIKVIYAEAKASGYSPKIMRQVVKRRAQDPGKLLLQEAELELYADAVGFGSLPLGKAATIAEPSHDPETGEISKSQAKAEDEADGYGIDEPTADEASRPDARRSVSTTSENGRDSRERPAPNNASMAESGDAAGLKPAAFEHGGLNPSAGTIDDDMPDIPACLDRREKVLESA